RNARNVTASLILSIRKRLREAPKLPSPRPTPTRLGEASGAAWVGWERENGPQPVGACKPLWKLRQTGLAVPSPVGLERIRVGGVLLEIRLLSGTCFCTCLPELLHSLDQLLARVTLLVTFGEELRAYDSLFIDHKSSRMGNAGKTSGRLCVANAVGVNRLAPFIGEQGEFELMLRCGALQHLGWIVADAHQRDPGRFDFLQARLQLN